MTLRKKTLLIITVTLVGLIVVLYTTSSTILLSSFAELEEQDTRHNIERAQGALYNELNNLNFKVADWAKWDDTYRFIEDANAAFVKSNLTDTALSDLRLNLMLFIHSTGRMVFGKGFDLNNMKATPIPESLKEHISARSILLQHPDTQSSRTGIILLPEGTLLIVSQPILTSEGKGPIRGTIIFGRYLDDNEIKHLANVTHLSLTVHRFNEIKMPSDFQTARSSLSEKVPILVRPLSKDFIAGYSVLRDIYGRPCLILRVDIPRAIYKQGHISIRYLISSLLVVSLVFGVVTILLLEKSVLSRLTRLSNDVSKIGASGNPSERLLLSGKDELSGLANTVNGMLEALEHSQHELRRARDELEIRVQERTAELAKANEALQADITKRKRMEEALQESEERYRNMIESSHDMVQSVGPDGRFIFVNKAWCETLGYTESELADINLFQIIHPDSLAHCQELFQKIISGESVKNVQATFLTKDGSLIIVEGNVTPRLSGDKVIATQGFFRDITERKWAEEQIKHQLERLSALHTIDMAISASLDLRATLNVLLDQVTTQLDIHAADVLLFNPHMQTLEFVAGHGFRSAALQYTRLRLGEGHAGTAALERRIVSILNLAEAENGLKRSPLLLGESFIAYFGVPLIAKGQVKGVLEIFHRSPLTPDQDWLNFLEALATQAAIAVDNAEMFNELQRSNIELTFAYDTTLEGWSRALDLRDKETEGHSQRVTNMTLRLARAMGMSEAELVHVRRGALLHDIGKIGIPDNILLKPGPLTDEEWEIMRKHPVYAHEMLLPIAFLRPALDIPYCHHEKWDGIGYPRGLKGEQIPLSARIFAVVDVYEALRSDRPYRPAWPEEKVREHLRSLAGTHFDPKIIEVFLEMEW